MEDRRSSTSSIGSKKGKRYKRSSTNNNNVMAIIPTSLVCSASHEAAGSGATELGVLLCMAVIGLYLFGFYESLTALPVPKIPNFAAHVGDNFNLAHFQEWDNNINAASRPRRQEDKDEQPEPRHDSLRGAALTIPQQPNHASPVQDQQQPPPVAGGSVKIPAAKWPVSIRDEIDQEYDTIIHPGDGETIMKVPKFWSPPVHNNQLMSRATAMQIGSCAEPDEHGNYNRGDDCPLDQRTIYVGIASYRDFECRSTAESIFLRAKNPKRIRIGVVDQIVDGEDAVCNAPHFSCDQDPDQGLCLYKDQIDVYQMDAPLSVGPVFARHIGYRLYRGEYYATQSDAHVTYTQDWDADIIQQLEATKNEMAVLSTYLTDVQGSIDDAGHSLRKTRPIMCNTRYEGGPQGMHLRHGSQPERFPSVAGTPQLQPWWAAGYSFSRGHFVVNVPYDWLQPMIFQGEEMSIGIRGFTIGYDFYAPERSVCFHHYAVGKNAKLRNKVPHFWENTKYSGIGKKAMSRLLGIVHMNPEIDEKEWDHADLATYGIGNVRTPEKFYEVFGINVLQKTVEGHLCSFVDTGAKMHHEFTPFLRSDGMGIDYGKITYQFKDPRPGEK